MLKQLLNQKHKKFGMHKSSVSGLILSELVWSDYRKLSTFTHHLSLVLNEVIYKEYFTRNRYTVA